MKPIEATLMHYKKSGIHLVTGDKKNYISTVSRKLKEIRNCDYECQDFQYRHLTGRLEIKLGHQLHKVFQ